MNLVRAAVKQQERWHGTTEQSPHIGQEAESPKLLTKELQRTASKTVTRACCKKKLETRSELIHK